MLSIISCKMLWILKNTRTYFSLFLGCEGYKYCCYYNLYGIKWMFFSPCSPNTSSKQQQMFYKFQKQKKLSFWVLKWPSHWIFTRPTSLLSKTWYENSHLLLSRVHKWHFDTVQNKKLRNTWEVRAKTNHKRMSKFQFKNLYTRNSVEIGWVEVGRQKISWWTFC